MPVGVESPDGEDRTGASVDAASPLPRQGRCGEGLPDNSFASVVPRRWEGPQRDGCEPLVAAHGSGGCVAAFVGRAGSGAGGRQREHPAVGAARPRRRPRGDDAAAGIEQAVGSTWPDAGPGPGVDHFPGGGAGVEIVDHRLLGRRHPGADLGVAGASSDEVYAALDYLYARQEMIEKALTKKYLSPAVNPSRMALFDLSSSWMTGSHCPLAKRGYSRDGKKGLPQIEYGLLTDPAGCPVAVRVFPGNTADPTAFTAAVTAVQDTFKLSNMVLVGDRGMITTARITAMKTGGALDWVTALRAPQIAALAADTGPLQMSLFDEQNFAEFRHPDLCLPRRTPRRLPQPRPGRPAPPQTVHRPEPARPRCTPKRNSPRSWAAVQAGRLVGADKIGLRIGKVLGRHKMAKHFHLDITDTTATITRNQAPDRRGNHTGRNLCHPHVPSPPMSCPPPR